MPSHSYVAVKRDMSQRFIEIDQLCQEILRNTTGKFYVCGGAVLCNYINEQHGDVDLFCLDRQTAERINIYLRSQERRFYRYHSSHFQLNLDTQEIFNMHLITAGSEDLPCRNVNIVWNTSQTTLEGILDSFDFTVCSVGYDPSTTLFYEPKNFQTLAKDRILSFNDYDAVRPAHSQIVRILKYMQKGFIPDVSVHCALLTALQAIKPQKIEDILRNGGLSYEYPNRTASRNRLGGL